MRRMLENLKHHARRLHRRGIAGEPEALKQLERVAELRGLAPEELSARLRRRHCLGALAGRLGFRGWPHARRVLLAEASIGEDLGELMTFEACGALTNIWSARYEEAREIRLAHGGFLLPFRTQFLIVEDSYLEGLGVSAADSDWDAIGRDWVAPRDRSAWTRLTQRRIEQRLAN